MSNKNKDYLTGIYEILINLLSSSFESIPEEIFENIKTINDPNILKELVNHLIEHNDLNDFSEFLERFIKEEEEDEKSESERDDYDSPWKEALEKFFPQCIQFFFPEAYEDIDWSKGFEFLDKELHQITKDAKIGRKCVDKLLKVWLKNGDEAHALIHLDVQNQHEKYFSKRMYIYNYRLFDRYETFVASFAILGDTSKKWNPETFEQERWDCKMKFQFPVVKLSKYEDDWEYLENNDNPFAVVVMAHIKTKATAKDDEKRLQEKLYIIKHLYKKGFTEKDIINLLNFIDWIMHTSEDYDKLFWQELEKLEKEEKMPYVTSWERLGYKRGYDEASQEAAKQVAEVSNAAAKQVAEVSNAAAKQVAKAKQTTAALLAKQIAKKFNTNESPQINLLCQLNQDDILELGENIIIMNTLGEIHNWINQKIK